MSWKDKIFREVEGLRDEVVSFLVELIRIPTENPPGVNYSRIANLIGRRLEELGYEVQYIEVPSERFPELVPFTNSSYRRVNVLAKLKGIKSRPTLHFNGHVDVVPAGEGWSTPPYEGVVKNGRVYGRGASDMKSGLAAMIYAVEAIRRAGYKLKGSVEYSFVVDEETAGVRNAGAYYLVEQGYISRGKTDYVVITEPLNVDRVCIGHRGAIWWRLKIYGRQAHGSMPYLGVNAAYKAATFIHLIEHILISRLKERVSMYPVVPVEARKPSINLGVVRCGTKVNTVPERCILELDRRLNPEESLDEAREEFRNVLEAMRGLDPEFQYDLEEIYYAPSTIVSENQYIVKVFEKSIGEVLNTAPQKVLSPGTDDQRFMVHHAGIEATVVYGPGRLELAHTVDEYVDINDLMNSIKVLALATVRLLGVAV